MDPDSDGGSASLPCAGALDDGAAGAALAEVEGAGLAAVTLASGSVGATSARRSSPPVPFPVAHATIASIAASVTTVATRFDAA